MEYFVFYVTLNIRDFGKIDVQKHQAYLLNFILNISK